MAVWSQSTFFGGVSGLGGWNYVGMGVDGVSMEQRIGVGEMRTLGSVSEFFMMAARRPASLAVSVVAFSDDIIGAWLLVVLKRIRDLM